MEEQNQTKKSLTGYKILIVLLAVILCVLSYMYYSQVQSMKQDFSVEKDTLETQITALMSDYDNIRTENDTISMQLNAERGKADSLMNRLRSERNLSISKIRKYEKELGSLRFVMQGYVQQIDSLNRVNAKLVAENVDYRNQVSSERQRAATAEDKIGELSTKVQRGAIIRARNIVMLALNAKDKEVTRASRASRLRVDFILNANELANQGERMVYVRIKGPDGYVLANSIDDTFEFNGERMTYTASRRVDYRNQDLSVSLYYGSDGIVSGAYQVTVYMDDHIVGTNEIVLK